MCNRGVLLSVISVLISCATMFAQGTTSRVLGRTGFQRGRRPQRYRQTDQRRHPGDLRQPRRRPPAHMRSKQCRRASLPAGCRGHRISQVQFHRQRGQHRAADHDQREARSRHTGRDGGSQQSQAETVQTSTSGNYGNLVTAAQVKDLPIVGTRGRNPLDLVVDAAGRGVSGRRRAAASWCTARAIARGTTRWTESTSTIRARAVPTRRRSA